MERKILFRLFILVLITFCAVITPKTVYGYPSNSMVKVCIMDSKYTTTEKTDVTIYGTDELVIKDNRNNEILHLPQGKFLSIKKGGKYILSYSDNENIEDVEFEIGEDFSIICPEGVIGIKGLIRGGKPALYRGEFRFISVPNKENAFYLVNCLDVEYYLKGVVPCEMPVHFGLEALKAQAVAARVYSLTPRTKMSRAYDVVDSVASQVYNGYNRESDAANKAIDETHGIVALYNDEMIIAVFSSTAGGYTESYSETFSDPITQQFPSPNKPYLVAKPDLPEFKPLDDEEEAFKFYSTKPLSYDIHSPLYRWTRTWTKDELERVLKNNLVVQSKTGFVEPRLTNSEDFGKLKDIRVTQRGVSGKIVFMEIETDKTVYTIGKELVIRRLFTKDGKALPSANVVFRNKGDKKDWSEITAYGGGFGHGCGLSQYGARYMAQDCKLPFDTILKHYYNGICLGTKPIELYKHSTPVCFYAPEKNAIITIPNRHGMENLQIDINGQVYNVDLDKAHSRAEIDISDCIKVKDLNIVTFTSPYQNKQDTRRHDRIKPVKIYIKLL
ncbi:MAG: SpoIID/LytB domain-containing protein [Cyanobacteria bacterium RUI128]|nr:SpoIID/LytB domain-containing protein [Cyanobacteria bacterium RUI128]